MGALTNGMQIDANVNANGEVEPLDVNLGWQQILVGMEATLRTMCVGEIARATIPARFAYGGWHNSGKAPPVPKDTIVTYEMEVLKIAKGAQPVPSSAPAGAPARNAPAGSFSSLPMAMGLIALLGLVMAFVVYKLQNMSAPKKGKQKDKGSKK